MRRWLITCFLPLAVFGAINGIAAVAETAELNDSVQRVAGLAGDRSLDARLAALKTLPKPLAAPDGATLLGLINDRRPYSNLQPRDEAYFVNELLNALRNSGASPLALSTELIALYNHSDRSVVVRDYALQHLSAMYGVSSNDDEILQTLTAALDNREGTLAGTALRGLMRIHRTTGAGDREGLCTKALLVAEDETGGVAARSAAVQACGELACEKAILLVRSLAMSESTQRVLRMAAIHALGQLGDASDLTFLQETSESRGFYVQASAKGRQQLLKKLNMQSMQQKGKKGDS